MSIKRVLSIWLVLWSLVLAGLVYSHRVEAVEIDARKAQLSELAIMIAETVGRPIFVAPAADTEVTVVNRYLTKADSLWYLERMVKHVGLTYVEERGAIFINVGGFDGDESKGLGPDDVTMKTKVYRLDSKAVKDASKVVDQVITALENEKSYQDGYQPKSSVSVLPDSTGLLVITSADNHKALSQLIPSLDIVQKQLSVKAIVYESTIGASESLGFQLALNKPDRVATVGSGSIGLVGTSGLAIDWGFGGGLSSLISALQTEADSTVLSTPSLSLLNGESAYITVGENVPIITGSQQTDSGMPFQTIERQDVGISLRVTAQVLPSGLIRLEVDQEASSISESEVSAADIITSQRQLQTVLMVRPGERVSLGGLIKEEDRKSKSGVPGVSSVPVFGALFDHNEEIVRKTVLNIILEVEVMEV